MLEKQDLQRKTHLKNVLQKQQEDQRRIETVQRAKKRKFKEQLKIDKADAKWEVFPNQGGGGGGGGHHHFQQGGHTFHFRV